MNSHKLEIYRVINGYRWRIRASNGRIVDASTEYFTRYRACFDNLPSLTTKMCMNVPLKWKRGANGVTVTTKGAVWE